MRIRSIRPEFWRSSDISVLPIEDRLLFIGLWSYVDDNGVGIDKMSAIAADLFADDLEEDAPETFARVSRGLLNLSERGRIIRYEVAGDRFLSIVNWERHQRIDKPGKQRFPKSDADGATIRESVASVPEKDPIGEGEKGRRGEGEKLTPSSAAASESSPEFDAFWSAFPSERKANKPGCRKKFAQAAKTVDPQKIIAAAAAYRDDPNREAKYTVNPHKWLNEERWESGPLPSASNSNIDQRRAENVQRLSQREPWDPSQQDPNQWGNEGVRALGR